MRAIVLTPFLLLAGCFGPTAVGSWEGTCEVSGSGYTVEIEVEFDIEEDKGGELAGEGEFSYYGYKFEGDVEGSRDGIDVEVEIDGEGSGYSAKMDIEAELEGDELSGDCSFSSVDGDFEAER